MVAPDRREIFLLTENVFLAWPLAAFDTQYCLYAIYIDSVQGNCFRIVLILLLLHPDPIGIWNPLAFSRFTEEYWNDLRVSLLNNRARKVVIFNFCRHSELSWQTAFVEMPTESLESICGGVDIYSIIWLYL